ncbi:MAG: coenzyme F(420) biosynthesis enzyme [Selenomonadaceae bacterium]|nr:coenzyme F(420) biosynthesis enzyme [Selenomonadaceae bacterium]
MKRLIQLLTMAMMLMMSTVCFAGQAETIEEGADLTKINKLTICLPYYTKMIDEEPTTDELLKALAEAGKKAKGYEVISYNDLAREIKADTAIDIRRLPIPESKKVYKEYVDKYADAYLFVTIANNSRVNLFGSVYKAGTNELLYDFRIEGGKEKSSKTLRNYQTLAERFYEAFGAAKARQLKQSRGEDDDE